MWKLRHKENYTKSLHLQTQASAKNPRRSSESQTKYAKNNIFFFQEIWLGFFIIAQRYFPCQNEISNAHWKETLNLLPWLRTVTSNQKQL